MGTTRSAACGDGRDRWLAFSTLTALAVARSSLFFGVNTFIALYWIKHFGASRELGGAALTCFLVGGVVGTLIGGRIADRFGMLRTIHIGSVAAVPAMVLLRAVPNAELGLIAVVLAGMAVNMPFAVVVKLGQDYLPTRPE